MGFWELTVPASSDTAEGLANLLWDEGALGVVEEEAPAGSPPRLRAFYPGDGAPAALVARVRDYLADLSALGFAVTGTEPAVAPLREDAWATAWQQAFPPVAVGERFLVVPPWEAARAAPASPPERLVLVIEPGRAFGTGHHGSTQGCLAVLDRAAAQRPLDRVLDIGTGSGILAVGAARLGARAVLAIDVDPDAVAAADANARRNGCRDRIDLALAGPESLPAGIRYPLVLANLLAQGHAALADQYDRLVEPGGRLVVGGMLVDQDGPVAERLAARGFAPSARAVVDGWVSLLLARRRA
jgi:ribosomal protein L11 methyltransferase